MRKAICVVLLLSTMLYTGSSMARLKKSMKKGCLICHQNWLLEAKIKSPELLTKTSLNAEDKTMCLSCHDGSIVDDRLTFMGLKKHSHPTDTEIPEDFKMPKGFPTKKGKLYCGTCHTPHTKTGSEKKLDYTFMREPNVNSALCIKCHEENRKKKENHPVLNDIKDKLSKKAIKNIKLLGGKVSTDSKVTCESCHSSHKGRTEKALVYYTNKSQLCVACHDDKLNTKKSPNPSTHIIHENLPENADLSLFKKKKAVVESVECLTCHKTHKEKHKHLIIASTEKLCTSCHIDESKVAKTDHNIENKLCITCHTAHNAKMPFLWARKIPEKAYDYAYLVDIKQKEDMLCLSCHYEGNQIGKEKVEDIGLITHPTGEKVKVETSLPLKSNREIKCATCHNPHYAYNKKKEGNFLRKERLSLCYECHTDKKDVKLSKHAQIDKKSKKGDCKACHTVHKAKDFMLSSITYSATSPNEPKVDGFCLACHDPNGMAEHKIRMTSNYEHPLGGKNESKNLPGKRIGCATCHEAHIKDEFLLRIAVTKNSKLCLECHDDKNLQNSSHDLINNKNAEIPKKEMQKLIKSGACSACHIPHNPEGKVLWSKKPGKGTTTNEKMCNSCHSEKGLSKKTTGEFSHPIGKEVKNTSLPMIDQLTGLPAKKGIKGVMDCVTCHDPHNGADSQKLIRYTVKGDSYLCTDCHKTELPVIGSEHDMRVAGVSYKNTLGEDIDEGGVCSACHVPHKAKGKFLWAFKTEKLDNNPTSNYCLNCHSEKGVAKEKTVKEFFHPSRDIVIRSVSRPGRRGSWLTFDINGKKVKFSGEITCATCHNPHVWSPFNIKPPGKNTEGTITNSFLRNKSIAGSICVDCHGIDALYRYKFFHDKRSHTEKQSYR